MNRRVDDLRRELAEVPEGILEDALLGRRLRHRIEVLHRAATAGAEVRAARRHPLRARLEHAHGRGLGIARPLAQHLIFHLLAGQRPLDEDGLAVHMADAATLVVERFDDCNGHDGYRAEKPGDSNPAPLGPSL